MAKLTEADMIWNRAGGDNPLRALPGDRALADMLYAHGLAMNGGLLHAIDCMTVEQQSDAEAGYRFFGFGDVASLLSRARSIVEAGDDLGNHEPQLNDEYARLIPSDQSLLDRLETRLKSDPSAFAEIRANDAGRGLETNMALPTFRYHPDPVETGHIIESDTECACCGKVRGFVYIGPVFAIEEYDEEICPWCIADGSAHEKLEASFVGEVGIGGGGMWDEVPEEIVREIAHRTPGFCGWQQEHWWTHCGDAAQFIGRAGRKELQALGPQAIAAIQESASLSDGQEWDDFLSALDKDGSPTAYLFRCTKCGQLGGYQDCD